MRTRGKSKKSEHTKAKILEAAICLLQEHGYEDTTMRGIAERAEVALGNIYYYFPSKEYLIQAFYLRLWHEQMEQYSDIFARDNSLKDRLVSMLIADLTVLEPYHGICVALFRHAADPQSPLSPFSEDSKLIRDKAVHQFARLLDGIREKIPDDLHAELPYLLWLMKMGILLYWIHDRSFGRIKTHRLVHNAADLVAMIVGLVTIPLMTPFRKKLLNTAKELLDPSLL